MQWKKYGKVWEPDGSLWWARKYATCPTPLLLDNTTLRVFVQCRDHANVGRVGFVDVATDDPSKILRVSEKPVLDVGQPGSFDDNGVFQTSVIRGADGKLFMYYVGFELLHHIRYRLLTGLAVSDDDGLSFVRVKRVPVLERSEREMYFRGGPFVLKDEGGPYRMWYVAGSEWEQIEGKAMPVYDLYYAQSNDGITWPDSGMRILSVDRSSEHGFGRPYIARKNGIYQLFYSVRKKFPRAYRMGYAESSDGLTWIRKDDEMGLGPSDHGWDSESVEFCAPVTLGDRTFCFYNGNDFGGSGFGLAELIN